MNASWFATHVDLLLYIYGGIAIALVIWTLWRVRRRKRLSRPDEQPSVHSD